MEVDMNMLPIQITDKGVLIPREYVQSAGEIELVVMEEYVLVRSKNESNNDQELFPSESSHFLFVGIAKSSNPKASVEVEEMND